MSVIEDHVRGYDNGEYEKDVNQFQFQILLPAFVFICILMVLGIPGNIVSILVYGLQLKSTTGRYAIIALAICDLINCFTSIPLELYIMTKYWSFEASELCKMSRYITYAMNNSSALILIAIAFERYRTICTPHKPRILKNYMKITCICLVFIGTIVALPALWVYGIQTDLLILKNDIFIEDHHVNQSHLSFVLSNLNDTDFANGTQYMWKKMDSLKAMQRIGNLTVTKRCMIDDRFRHDWFAFLHFCIITVGSVVILLVLIVIYLHIARKIYGLRKIARTNSELGKNAKASAKKKQATLMVFLITLAFEFTFIPFLIITNIRFFAMPGWYNLQPRAGKMAYHFFLRSYLFNCAINPFIYCVSCPQFRTALCSLNKRLRRNKIFCGICEND